MAVESAADRLAFLDTDEFGVEATYTPAGGGASSTVKGIFDNTFIEADAEAEVNVQASVPVFTCRTADLTSGGVFNDQLVISGVTYKAKIIRPDGTGMTSLFLEKQ